MENWAGMLYGAAVAFVTSGLIFGLGLVILAQFNVANLANPALFNSTGGVIRSADVLTGNGAATLLAVNKSITATAEIPNNWLTLIAIVIAAVIILGLVLGGLAFAMGNGRR
jgi:hypothetical protein